MGASAGVSAGGGSGSGGPLGGVTNLLGNQAAATVAGGLLVGAVAGATMLAAGVVNFSPRVPARVAAPASEPALAVVACPGSQVVVTRVPAGRQLLATGRSADGNWIQVALQVPGVHDRNEQPNATDSF